jgi:hypothetical protein
LLQAGRDNDGDGDDGGGGFHMLIIYVVRDTREKSSRSYHRNRHRS